MPDDDDDDDKGGATVRTPRRGEPAPAWLPPRYLPVRSIHLTPSSHVLEVHDLRLDRRVALKVCHVADVGARERDLFEKQAAIAVRLQHPNIVPVYDVDVLEDGRPYFVMRLVEGHHLGQHIPGPEGVDPWNRNQLVNALALVAGAVASAHELGVIHRDIKPRNVVTGRHGDVILIDWGISKVLGRDEDASAGVDGQGTPRWWAPEQAEPARGAEGPHTDVWALGVCLLQILSQRPPPTSLATAQDVTRVLDTVDWRGRPGCAPLEDLVLRCLRVERTVPSATEMVEGLQRWLDGRAKEAQADVGVREAKEAMAAYRALDAVAARLSRRAEHAWAKVPTHAPPERKARAWTLEDRAAAAARAAREAESAAEQKLSSALELAPDHQEARGLLAEHYLAQVRNAETLGDERALTRFSTLLRGSDPARWSAWKEQGATLHLQTSPPGARVTVYRYVERLRQLVPERVGEVGVTPVDGAKVPPGSLLLVVEHPDCEPTRLPLVAARGEEVRVRRPGADVDEVIPLPALGSLADDDCYVPPGWFIAGDSEAPDGWPRQRVWLDGFVMKRYPVTNMEYLEFLRDMPAGELEGLMPRVRALRRKSVSEFQRTAGARPCFSATTEAEFPAVGISAVTAEAYACWRRERDGYVWRLPHELEWEKAARGVDGRRYPWGDTFDSSFANTLRSRPGEPRLDAVGRWPADQSPFGVRDLSGNARTWCLNSYSKRIERVVETHIRDGNASTYRVVRGGAYGASALFALAAARFAGPITDAHDFVGLRLVR